MIKKYCWHTVPEDKRGAAESEKTIYTFQKELLLAFTTELDIPLKESKNKSCGFESDFAVPNWIGKIMDLVLETFLKILNFIPAALGHSLIKEYQETEDFICDKCRHLII